MLSIQFLSLQIEISWNKKEAKVSYIERLLHEKKVEKILDEMKNKQAEFVRYM